METVTQFFSGLYQTVAKQFWSLMDTPFDPSNRLFWLYLISAIFFSYWVYYSASRTNDGEPRSLKGFASFVFPTSVWRHPSAWLDLRFFLVNQFTGKLLYVGLTGVSLGFVFYWITGGLSLVDAVTNATMPTWGDVFISIIYMFVVIGLTDFTAFYIHYLQHKIPILWEFHKVHHSPEVMHPLSNFREHPFDNVVYALGIGAVYGLVIGGVHVWLGYLPSMPAVLGVPLLLFLFNIGGYHLRHSHVWLRWPGIWSMVFPSPAHHHVHHSSHPDHLDKNFAFLFPLWDVLFKTYHMPQDNRDVKFGIYGMEDTEYTSISRLYFLPFRNIYRRLRRASTETEKPAPSRDQV
ncbi:sterol desaturase family protein [Yoonia sp. SS1-5]|uniref:Sterol desaturase family protein n=1 Tax=Yoonia rhodophyticola TaxID=3137370 RepID=A0AAN0MFY0_9RHOB